MPPPRRARPRRRRRSSSAVEAPCASEKGWLSVRRRVFKREGRGRGGDEYGDDGLPFGDETLLLIFSGLLDTRDLVRCAATCRRWRRLVSADAAFICRRAPPRCDRFVRRLALGFFLHGHDGGAEGGSSPPRFVPFVSSLRQQLSLGAIVDGGDGRMVMEDSSRVVASRNGRVVLDLRRSKSRCVLRLCVCDPMTGGADFLPPLRGRDSPGPYACTVLTTADGLHLYSSDGKWCAGMSSSSSSYRVLLVYNRRSFTALRCYSSDTGGWGPEVQVTGASIGRKRQLSARAAHASLVRGGVVCWPGLAVALQLPTLQTSTPPYTVQGFHAPRRDDAKNTTAAYAAATDRLLGVMPDGRLCVVEANDETIRAYVVGQTDVVRCGGLSGRKERLWTLKVALLIGPPVHAVRLRWFCEKSGVVLFTARSGCRSGGGGGDPRITCVYAVDVETMQVGRVAGGEWSGEADVCGYEMDRVAMLADLHI